MTTYELIEHAVLDALGILEPEERDAFERALAGASDEVRAQVRDEQARLVDLGDLLPDESPRPELRAMVVSAVRAAMAREHEPVAGRIGPAGAASFRPAKRVSRLWRVAAVALGAATIALSAATLEVRRIQSEAGSRLMVDALYDRFGAQKAEEMIFDPRSQRVALTPASDGAALARAAVWSHPEWEAALLFVSKLKTEPGERLRLVVLDDQGRVVEEVARFESTGEVDDLDVVVDFAKLPNLAICRTVGDAQDVLMTAAAGKI